MQTNQYLFTLIFLATFFITQAQSISIDVMSSSGNYFSSSSGSITYTMGELMGETYSSSNNFLTQGFNQVNDVLVLTNISNETINNSAIKTFPNPVIKDLAIQFDQMSGEYIIQIFNTLGEIIFYESITNNDSTQKTYLIPFEKYISGSYFIQIINLHTQLKTNHIIVKQ